MVSQKTKDLYVSLMETFLTAIEKDDYFHSHFADIFNSQAFQEALFENHELLKIDDGDNSLSPMQNRQYAQDILNTTIINSIRWN